MLCWVTRLPLASIVKLKITLWTLKQGRPFTHRHQPMKFSAWCKSWLTTLIVTSDVHPVFVSGITQFQLVHIHPFLDGNGRSARLLSTLCLYRKGYDFKRLFTISEYYDRNHSDYYKAIQSVRENDMDMALSEQMQEIITNGEIVIRADVLCKRHHLSSDKPRQCKYFAVWWTNDKRVCRALLGYAKTISTARPQKSCW